RLSSVLPPPSGPGGSAVSVRHGSSGLLPEIRQGCTLAKRPSRVDRWQCEWLIPCMRRRRSAGLSEARHSDKGKDDGDGAGDSADFLVDTAWLLDRAPPMADSDRRRWTGGAD